MLSAEESRQVAQRVLDKMIQEDLARADAQIKEVRERGGFSTIVSFNPYRDEVAVALSNCGYGLSPFSDRDGSVNVTITW